VLAQAAALGVSVPTEIPTAPTEIDVWPENWPTLIAFLAAATQWRAAAGFGFVMWLGLDYGGLDRVLARHPDASFEDLQAMEAEALTILNESD
jgi:hypothetical protein